MGTAQKLGVLVIALAMITTVSLPDRHFERVVDAGGRFVSGTLGTAMGTRTG
jgi:hypothetical protein